MYETFNVGDKVIMVTSRGVYGSTGTVVKITEKRQDVKVKFDGREDRIETYTYYGYQRGHGVWDVTWIKHYTDAVAKEIADTKVVNDCRSAMRELTACGKLTPNMARRILNVINQEKEGNNE